MASFCHHPMDVAEKFPRDEPLAEMGIQSYLGVPLRDSDGNVMGHLAVFDERPMPAEPRRLFIFRIFAARAAAELNRLRMEQMLKQSEQRYRDLFDEAPIPYVYEDTETRVRHGQPGRHEAPGPQARRRARHGRHVARRVDARRIASSLDAVFADIRQGKEQRASLSWSSAARTMASRSGCSSGRAPSRTASTRGR